MFKWRKKTPPQPSAQGAPDSSPRHSMTALLRDRSKLGEWVETYMIRGIPWQENFRLVPNDEAQRDLEITFEQKERLAKEYHVLSIAGVLIFLRQHYDDASYEATLNDLAGRLAEALSLDRLIVGEALGQYVRYSLAGETNSLETLYLQRVYDDNPHFFRMKFAGIGSIAIDRIGLSFDVFRDAVNGEL
ncbi:hypothetical protein IP84_04220 [beta proteobacterium AAP99]|nr:hypothetical protein IP84_04220 [beta proteobacterium AAP99]